MNSVIITDAMAMSDTMTSLVFHGPGVMVYEPRTRPCANYGEVVVAVSAAGICGSELSSFTGDSARRPPGRPWKRPAPTVVPPV